MFALKSEPYLNYMKKKSREKTHLILQWQWANVNMPTLPI
jgi:hypothetical protein